MSWAWTALSWPPGTLSRSMKYPGVLGLLPVDAVPLETLEIVIRDGGEAALRVAIDVVDDVERVLLLLELLLRGEGDEALLDGGEIGMDLDHWLKGKEYQNRGDEQEKILKSIGFVENCAGPQLSCYFPIRKVRVTGSADLIFGSMERPHCQATTVTGTGKWARGGMGVKCRVSPMSSAGPSRM